MGITTLDYFTKVQSHTASEAKEAMFKDFKVLILKIPKAEA
jgi:hypothetical protein